MGSGFVVWRVEKKIKIACACCSCCDVGMSGGELCVLRRGYCLTGLSNGSFVGWVNGQLHHGVWFARVVFGNEFPFFVEGLYEKKFVWS